MWEETIDDTQAALKLVFDWFGTIKIIKNLFAALYADENILYFNGDSGNVAFSCNEMDILNVDLGNNFDEDDPDTVILIRLLVWYIKFEKRKELKKELNEELMSTA